MKLLLASLFCLVVSLGAAQVVTPAEPIDLFNGKDFSGFTFFMRSNSPPEKTWNITTNGCIHCSGYPVGFLRTDKSYADYHLTVEWRFVKVAPHADNTGVLVHMQLPDKIWSKCIECQGQSQKQGDYWLHSGASAVGYPSDGKKSVHVPMTSQPNEHPVGEWNTFEVLAKDATVETIVNGKSMNKISGANITSGFIGIQSEGADIEVRKIFLAPLPRQ